MKKSQEEDYLQEEQEGKEENNCCQNFMKIIRPAFHLPQSIMNICRLHGKKKKWLIYIPLLITVSAVLGFAVLSRNQIINPPWYPDEAFGTGISNVAHRVGESVYSDEKSNTKFESNFISKKDTKQSVLDLNDALYKINQLEKKIKNLEARTVKTYADVKFLTYKDRKRILITGGAGFVGSHLVDRLLLEGHEVIVVDNFFTGRKRNVEHWIGHENFELINHDIVNPIFIEVDQIYHLASPASPPHYMYNPVKTIKTNTVGTINILGLGKRVGARVLIASTSEVYGDPEIHPQPETYWGHVNPIGPRACYDEAKRVAETLAYAYQKQENIEVRVARIFNTYGPRMHMNDGRVVSNFILQAIQGKDITVYGHGHQTRSFQYVSDLVDGLIKLMNSNYSLPVNLGNPDEHTIDEFATIINNLVGGKSAIVQKPAVEDDPQRRKPDITRAKIILGWEPKISLNAGLEETIKYFRGELHRSKHTERNVQKPTLTYSENMI